MKWNTKETLFVEYANILKLIIDIFCGFGWLIDWEYKDVILTGKGSQKYYESNLKSNIILLWKYTINLNREIFKNLMTIYIRKEWHGLCFWHNNSFLKKTEPIFLPHGISVKTSTFEVRIGGYLICLFGGFRPTRKFFTHLETSPLPVEGCKFWPMLGTHDHWAVMVL